MLRILLIEDCADDAELLALELDEAGLAATWTRVAGETELLSAVDEPAHDVVVSDLGLPGFSGLRALQLVRAAQPDVPFIFLSGDPGEDAMVTALQAGANEYVHKQELARMPAVIRCVVPDA